MKINKILILFCALLLIVAVVSAVEEVPVSEPITEPPTEEPPVEILTTTLCDGSDILESICQDGNCTTEILAYCRYGCKNAACERKTTILSVNDFVFPLSNELELTPIEILEDNILAIVPGGYEPIGQNEIGDLQYCFKLVPESIGINSQYDGIIIKIYVSNDGTMLYSYNEGKLVTRTINENLDLQLNEVLTGNPFYIPSSDSCRNSHEFTHYLINSLPMPTWANEGMAVYSSWINVNQDPPVECRENGYYGYDYSTNQERLLDYADLSEPFHQGTFSEVWSRYTSSACFWKLFDEKFGKKKRKEVFKLLGENYVLKSIGPEDVNYDPDLGAIQSRYFQVESEQLIDFVDPTKFFIEEILYSVVNKNELDPILEKFGLLVALSYSLEEPEITADLLNEEEQEITSTVERGYSVLEKIHIISKSVKKIRTTKVYLANKIKMEPLLEDIEKQIDILKEIANNKFKTKVTQLTKAELAVAKKKVEKGFLTRIFGGEKEEETTFVARLVRFTGGFFKATGNAINLRGLILREPTPTITTPLSIEDTVIASSDEDEKKPTLAIKNLTMPVKKPAAEVVKSKVPTAKGQWTLIENQLKQLKNDPVFKDNKDVQKAIAKIEGDVAELKEIVVEKVTPTKKGLTLPSAEEDGEEGPAPVTKAEPKKAIGLVARIRRFFRR